MSYDAANRLVEIKNDANTTTLESYRYGVGNARVTSESGGLRTYYTGGGGQASVEYTQAVSGGGVLHWSKSYIYAGGSILATISPSGVSEYVEYHHPDRLGTRLISNNQNTNVQEQETLPFGAALASGSGTRQFTSYDRSSATGLDYAVNRRYDSLQGRFTQVDPIGMQASSLADPQSLNLYAYCGNDPVNHVDPDGLFFKKLFKWLSKALKWVMVAIAVAAVVLLGFGPVLPTLLFKVLTFVAGIPNMIGGFVSGIPKTIAGIFSFGERATSIVTGIVGGAVLSGASTAAGAISNHLQRQGDGRGNDIDSAIYRAYADALSRLNKTKCRQYIQGGGAEDPKTALKKIYRKHEIKFDPTVTDMGNATLGAGSKARINIGREFFRDNPGGFKGPQLPTARSARSFVLLHELRHAVSGIGHPRDPATGKLIPNVPESNEDFTKNILKNCF